MMLFIKNNLANLLTLLNLGAGTVCVIALLDGNYTLAAICLIVSLVMDFFDGFVARLLKADSALGIQLDSLADMVSFGVVPGMAMYLMLSPFQHQFLNVELPFEVKYIGLLITLFSCLRLAIFNIDTEQAYYFKGLNTPTNTLLIFSLAHLAHQDDAMVITDNAAYLVFITLLSSYLLVSPIKMIALKFKSLRIKDNIPKLVLLAGCVLLIFMFGLAGIPLSVVYYVLVSLVFQRQFN